MKFPSVLLLAVSSATAEWTCEDCTAVVGSVGQSLLTEKHMQQQIEILLREVCPTVPDVDECLDNLPDFWTKVSNVLWPGYWDPEAEWMCAQEEGVCGPPAGRGGTCEECEEGIVVAIEQLLSEEAISVVVDALSGPRFCGAQADQESCSDVIHDLIPKGMVAFDKAIDQPFLSTLCNQAISGRCSGQ